MAKDTFYFSHDYYARKDPKCVALIQDFGQAGYGVYWSLVEMMYEQGGKIKKFPALYSSLARELGMPLADFMKQIEAMLHDYDLLQADDQYIWSNAVLARLDIREEKRSTKASSGKLGGIKSGESRRNKKEAKQNEASLQSNEAPLEANEANEAKESKGKESNTLSLGLLSNDVFSIREGLEVKREVKEGKGNKEGKREENGALQIPFQNELFMGKWQEWKTVKAKEHKFHYKTTQSEQVALNQLSDLANGVEAIAIAIINQSIANGWKGFFELKNNNQNGKGQYSNNSNRVTVNFSEGQRKPL